MAHEQTFTENNEDGHSVQEEEEQKEDLNEIIGTMLACTESAKMMFQDIT